MWIAIETCEKISQSLLEYYKDNISSTKGRKHNNDAKIKMRLSAIKRIEQDKLMVINSIHHITKNQFLF